MLSFNVAMSTPPNNPIRNPRMSVASQVIYISFSKFPEPTPRRGLIASGDPLPTEGESGSRFISNNPNNSESR
jgi:hypothetical protein